MTFNEGSWEHPARVEETDRGHGGGIFCVRIRKVILLLFIHISKQQTTEPLQWPASWREKRRSQRMVRRQPRSPSLRSREQEQEWLTLSGTRWCGPVTSRRRRETNGVWSCHPGMLTVSNPGQSEAEVRDNNPTRDSYFRLESLLY